MKKEEIGIKNLGLLFLGFAASIFVVYLGVNTQADIRQWGQPEKTYYINNEKVKGNIPTIYDNDYGTEEINTDLLQLDKQVDESYYYSTKKGVTFIKDYAYTKKIIKDSYSQNITKSLGFSSESRKVYIILYTEYDINNQFVKQYEEEVSEKEFEKAQEGKEIKEHIDVLEKDGKYYNISK